MATRSVIAEPNEGGWRGRYCHSDGYPRYQVPALLGIIKKLGVEGARRFLMHENKGWSILAEDVEDCLPNDLDHWFTDKEPPEGLEWAYVLADEHIEIYTRVRNDGSEETSWLHVGQVTYDEVPDEEALYGFECGASLERCTHYAWVHFPEAKGTTYNTHQWLRNAEPKLSNAKFAEIDGIRYELSGGGSIGTRKGTYHRINRFPNDGENTYWWMSTRTGNKSGEVCVAKVESGQYVLLDGVRLIFPPTSTHPDPLVREAGAVLR